MYWYIMNAIRLVGFRPMIWNSTLTLSAGQQCQNLFVKKPQPILPLLTAFLMFSVKLIKVWDVKYCCLNPNCKLQIKLFLKKGKKSYIHKLFEYFLNIWEQRHCTIFAIICLKNRKYFFSFEHKRKNIIYERGVEQTC